MLWRSLLLGLLLICTPAAQALQVQVENADLRALILELADAAKMEVLVSDKVQGKVSYRRDSAKPAAVLASLLQAQGLQRERVGRVWWIAPADDVAQRHKRHVQQSHDAEALQPVQAEVVRLRYLQAQDIAKLLGSGSAQERWLGPRGRVDAEQRSNSVLLRDNRTRLAAIRAWLSDLDAPPAQVLVETRIMAVSRNQAQALGVQWGWQHPESSAQLPFGVVGADVSALRYGILAQGLTQLDVQLSALLSEGEGEILARPSVVAQHLQKALIASGQQIPYQETTHSGATTTRFVNAELSLELTPIIGSAQDIQLSLVINHDSPGEIQPNGARAIDTNRLQTQVRLHDGQTLALGGIFRQQSVKATSRAPFLGKILGLGWLFRRHTERNDKQELFIFVTPRLLTPSTMMDVRPNDGESAGEQHISNRADGRG